MITIRGLLSVLFVLAILRCLGKIVWLSDPKYEKTLIRRSRGGVAAELIFTTVYAALLLYIIMMF
jgi:hypothetical protein